MLLSCDVYVMCCYSAAGHGFPGVAGTLLEGLFILLLIGGVSTEVIKFAQGMQGGETGTGGRF